MNTSEYSSYYEGYIALVSNEPLKESLKKGQRLVSTFFSEIPEEKRLYRYAEGKWTPQEVLLHLIDTERVFIYRALQFARSENADLAGFDQDEFVAQSNANHRSMKSLIDEFNTVRAATLSFIENCPEEVLKRSGRANGSPLSVRAAATIICGHEIHHIQIIRERYL